jgi:hypothetical protein
MSVPYDNIRSLNLFVVHVHPVCAYHVPLPVHVHENDCVPAFLPSTLLPRNLPMHHVPFQITHKPYSRDGMWILCGWMHPF